MVELRLMPLGDLEPYLRMVFNCCGVIGILGVESQSLGFEVSGHKVGKKEKQLRMVAQQEESWGKYVQPGQCWCSV